MNRRRFSVGNGILIVLSILLGVLLICFLLWNRKTEQETALALSQLDEKEENDNEFAAGSDDSMEDDASVLGDDNEPPIEANNTETEQNDQQTEDTQEMQSVESAVQGISYRGDSFGSDENKDRNGIGSCLSEILEENNLDIKVEDYSMDVAGTLSQLRLAGVAQSELDAYLQKHQSEANGSDLRITETKIRDLTEEELVRTDQSYIPVICMGYYGGWGDDPEELCDQQQKLLDTYQQSEKYLILGVYPTGFSDEEAYKQTMVSRWGEHFVMVNDEITHSVSSSEGKKEMAQLIYDKLTEFGYLS